MERQRKRQRQRQRDREREIEGGGEKAATIAKTMKSDIRMTSTIK